MKGGDCITYAKNDYLTLQEMTINAQYILNDLLGKGWTKESVCGMLGNMQTESTINSGIWQNLDEGNSSMGFGLVQWTPSTKYTDWATANGFSWGNINGQLQRLQYEIDNGLQWIATGEYPISFQTFKTSTASVEYLAQAFLKNYERPAEQNQPNRSTQARYWYDVLDGEGNGLCVQLAQFPMDMINISQGENGSFSHQNKYAIDFVGTTSKYPYNAPCDCICIGRDDSEAMMMWKSLGQVMCADGVLREIKWWCIHEEPLVFEIGDILNKGQHMGYTGVGAFATGDHLHLQVFELNSNTELHIYDVFAVNDVNIINGLGYDWKTSTFVDCSNNGGGENIDVNKNTILLLMCDALNGWKW